MKSAYATKTELEDKDLWETPWYAVRGSVNILHRLGFIPKDEVDLDTCANKFNAKANKFISKEQDTLVTPWGEDKLCWLNPPYSSPLPFIKKAVAETENGNYTVALLKGDNSTGWYRYCIENAIVTIPVLEGRINFIHAKTGKSVGGNNFPSVFFLFGPNKPKAIRTVYKTLRAFKKRGGYDTINE